MAASSTPGSTYLAIDIGGTKTLLAVYRLTDDSYTPLAKKRFRSADYGGVEAIIEEFRTDLGFCPDSVILGIAGVAGETQAMAESFSGRVTLSR